MDLARAEKLVAAVLAQDAQMPALVDPAGGSAAAVPLDALTEQRVALAPGVHDLRPGSREPVFEQREQPLERGLDRVRRQSERARALAQLRRELRHVDRDVDADAEHRPVLLRAALDQDARDLAALQLDVVGPFQRGAGPGELGDRDRGRDRQERRRVAQHQRAQQRAPRRRVPAPALAAATVALGVGGDERAVRRAGAGQRSRVRARRAGHAPVHARGPQPRAALRRSLPSSLIARAAPARRRGARSSSAAAEPPLTASASDPRASR